MLMNEALKTELQAALSKSVEYCEANNWAGYDPYDALNSFLFEKIQFLDSRIFRLALTQLLKRSPVNPRRALGIQKTQNPKALALLLSALVKAADSGVADYRQHCDYLIERLQELRSPDQQYWCWGYSFPWQTRTVIVPASAPNLVCTTFVATALLDAYESCANSQYLKMAVSAAEYIIEQLYWSGAETAGFAYPLPTVRNQVHNANFLAAALLSRVGRHTGDTRFLEPAIKATRFSASRQNPDGSWPYGQGVSQGFVDNFHTGFNLCALHTIMRELRTDEFEDPVKKGFAYYRENFYRRDGSVRYFNNRTYPIDIHAVAQSIITPIVLDGMSPSNIQLSASVFSWAMKHMWDPKGYFYYRALRLGTIRIPYMRWSQAWMVSAVTQLLCSVTSLLKDRGVMRSPAFALR